MASLLQVSKDLPEAMAVMGFAFYVAPMLLPLRAEMPSGQLIHCLPST